MNKDAIAAAYPGRTLGFAVLIFDMDGGKPGHTAYIANANRSDMVQVMRGVANKLESSLGSFYRPNEFNPNA